MNDLILIRKDFFFDATGWEPSIELAEWVGLMD